MLTLSYDYTAIYKNVTLTETNVTLIIALTDLPEVFDKQPKNLDKLEIEIYDKYKDDVQTFCKAIDLNVYQDALDYCIINYFSKYVTELEEFPEVEVFNIKLQSSLINESDEEVIYDA